MSRVSISLDFYFSLAALVYSSWAALDAPVYSISMIIGKFSTKIRVEKSQWNILRIATWYKIKVESFFVWETRRRLICSLISTFDLEIRWLWHFANILQFDNRKICTIEIQTRKNSNKKRSQFSVIEKINTETNLSRIWRSDVKFVECSE